MSKEEEEEGELISLNPQRSSKKTVFERNDNNYNRSPFF